MSNEGGQAPERRRDLLDPELFGNEAGDDEPIEVLGSYFLNKHEFARFSSPETKLGFVRSRKGVGKSTLLKKTLYDRQQARAGRFSSTSKRRILPLCKTSTILHPIN